MPSIERMIAETEYSKEMLISLVCDLTENPAVVRGMIDAIIETTIFVEQLKKDQKIEEKIDGKIFSQALKIFAESMDCIVVMC